MIIRFKVDQNSFQAKCSKIRHHFKNGPMGTPVLYLNKQSKLTSTIDNAWFSNYHFDMRYGRCTLILSHMWFKYIIACSFKRAKSFLQIRSFDICFDQIVLIKWQWNIKINNDLLNTRLYNTVKIIFTINRNFGDWLFFKGKWTWPYMQLTIKCGRLDSFRENIRVGRANIRNCYRMTIPIMSNFTCFRLSIFYCRGRGE